MGTYSGNSGLVAFSGGAILNVQEYECTIEGDIIPSTAMGRTWETQLDTAKRRWSGSFTCWYDRADTLGQNLGTPGASVTIVFLPGGSGAGLPTLTGPARIRTREVTGEKDGIVTLQCTFVGDGTLTESGTV